MELLPEAPEGWTRIFQSIADTPELQKKADELLNFDDAVFVDYSRGDSRLSVYIAYWSPGRMSHRLIAGHTPDVCWVGSGWKCIERGRNTMARKINSSSSPQLTRHFYLPAETRTFSAHGITEYVWFWHLVGGKNISYGTNAEPPWFATLSDIVDNGLNQREEQFFIRLSSPNPLGYSDLSPILEMVLESLPLYSNNNKYQVLRTKLNVDFLHSRLIASGGNPID